MKRFSYKARDKTGKLVVGKVEAVSPQAAARTLREKGLVVVWLEPERESISSLLRKFRDRVTLSDLSAFTRQLSTMITAGLPITDALLILRTQASPAMGKVVSAVLLDVEGGSSLADAMSRHPKVFSQVYVSIVRAGETGGVLDEVLARLADNLEKEREFRAKVKGALIYPAIVVVGMFVVAAIMLIFVIPRLTSLYKEFNAELPIATQILISVSGFASRFWYLVLVILILAAWAFSLFRKTPEGRRRLDALIFRIPIFGPLQQQIILTEFTRTLGLLVGAGISILEALNVVANAVGNVIVQDAIKAASRQVEKGFPLAYALAQQGEVFPPMLYQMLSVGEETGKLDEVLGKVSHVFEVESEQQVKGLTAAIEPLIMIFLGIGVGFLVIAIILPIYNLTSQF